MDKRKDCESLVTFKAKLKRYPLVYVETKNIMLESSGRYYLITDSDDEPVDVTNDIVEVFEACEIPYEVIKMLNTKTGVNVRLLKHRHPETMIRDLSHLIYGRWDAIRFYKFGVERIF